MMEILPDPQPKLPGAEKIWACIYNIRRTFFKSGSTNNFQYQKALFVWGSKRILVPFIAYFPRSFLLLLLLLLVVFWSLWLPGPPGPMMFLFDRHTHVHTRVWGGKMFFFDSESTVISFDPFLETFSLIQKIILDSPA